MAALYDQLLAQGAAGFQTGAREQAQRQEDERNAKLKQLLLGQQLSGERENKSAELGQTEGIKNRAYQRDLDTARQLRGEMGQDVSIDSGDIKIGSRDPLRDLLKRRELSKPDLTPGQIEAEKMAAKKLADYEASGGRSTAEKNISQIAQVESDLTPNARGDSKRDWYDRKVGGLLNAISPSLMGSLAPAEKARRDQARSAANMLARQSDPNPTAQQVDAIMGQIYDPASDNATNLQRIKAFQAQQRGVNSQMSQAASNLSRTGYSMPGIAGNPASPGYMAPSAASPAQSSGLEHLSDDELADMARKLGISK